MSEPQPLATEPLELSAETHPIVPGFYSDPTICRVGDDYFLTHSSFEYFPGAPIFHSTDLVSWRQIGNILDRRSQFPKRVGGPSTGIYGSTLRHHDGVFWFTTTNVSDFAAGQLIVHATDPAGPWSEPVFVPEAMGIDPDLCWDIDGTCYLTWHRLDFEAGGQGILQAPIDLETGRLLEAPYPLWQGSGMPMAEGPHLYRIDGWWYIVLAEGGTERGHCVTIARSRSPRGPFESCPSNPILTHRSSAHPVQNVGHADLVQGPDGSWAAVYLGVRPRGSTPMFHTLGRETFLAGVDWVDGWPMIDESRFLLPESRTGFVDDFPAGPLHLRWVVPDGESGAIVAADGSRGVRFPTWGSGADVLCSRVTDFAWHADAVAEGAGAVGVRIDDRHWCRLVFEGGEVKAEVRIGDVRHTLATVSVETPSVVLRVTASEPSTPSIPFGHAGPDELALTVIVDDEEIELARLDGRYFSTEVAGGFTGRMLVLGSPSPVGRIARIEYLPGAV
ncbi:glycoside hydrolase family 43 protein [Microbacterium phyllosphaerae]|uniref:glycoside hydrolase family 43 protein n=1 Tax=Microbacterium phyllosphaerae TaxID=124798 RepID=UPI002166DAB8|nr:glycoside hydrolase family 43 protein [Microbacterium phyllosphaerae]MCS3444168.1 coenzyme F420-reducing hydrogenase delta subunit [Microbacterium phyllosphaerae]